MFRKKIKNECNLGSWTTSDNSVICKLALPLAGLTTAAFKALAIVTNYSPLLENKVPLILFITFTAR